MFLQPRDLPLADLLVASGEAHGWDVRYRRPGVFTPDQVEPGVHMVFVYGLRGVQLDIYKAFRAAHVPVMVIENPPLRDLPDSELPVAVLQGGQWPNYLGIYPGIPGAVWEYNVVEARTDVLPLPPRQPRTNTTQGDPYVLLLGQVPNDAALGSQTSQTYADWLRGTAAALLEAGYLVLWRPHPKAPEFDPFVGMKIKHDTRETLMECLMGRRPVLFAVTWSSSSQYTCYRQGVPCIVGSLGDACDSWEQQTEAVMRQRLARAAWCTWTREDLELGVPWDVLPNGPPRAVGMAPSSSQQRKGSR